ncbi:sensor histidine kinase [Paenibacillus pasadenensis]|uniref:histidine kinase n=1 Tax=Paenibacillus pasadenensis TaxID=217090 RepID=A0A2N5N1P3_9BACL|nr:HAMP domain-containing sensor histidine kinase [Paenibacillus pasadenensis]PLT44258.1 two-component system sensor protein [Paenibacillus pasadenensis]
MLIYFFALLAAGAAALLARPREAESRWAAAFLALASLGGAASWLERAGQPAGARALELLNACLTPWAVLVFALVWSGLLAGTGGTSSASGWSGAKGGTSGGSGWRGARDGASGGSGWRVANGGASLLVALILLLPPLVSLGEALLRGGGPHYGLLLVWTAPYYLAACAAMILAVRREAHPLKRRSRAIMAVIMVPTLLAVLGLINVGRAISPDFDFFRYVSLFIVFSMGAAAAGLFLYGVLGIRLRLERDPLESAMRAAGLGASMLNHSLKNELGKISLASELLRRELERGDAAKEPAAPAAEPPPASAPPPSKPAARGAEQLQQIQRSAGRMLETVERLQTQLKAIRWQAEPVRLPELLARAAERSAPLAASRGVQVSVRSGGVPEVALADPFHLEESLVNLLANAIEATPAGGEAVVSAQRQRRRLLIRVDDTGEGIAAERLAQAFEPFYSTKSGRMNYGIGLSYAHQAMRMAGGSVRLERREGGGTRAELRLPQLGRQGGEEERR